ncbi:hypothetical protein LshimejAT787_1402330 [Lyophyllum shimeji]|uniref:Uncharacterized protein n=1 Tax=Lyophyllum shimeji TaxID=47721 RepID=A0A9P3UV27_LYOSH|nr:hypothetical protein LshimejAT787_1402330 [Lyophyllum shimeji]
MRSKYKTQCLDTDLNLSTICATGCRYCAALLLESRPRCDTTTLPDSGDQPSRRRLFVVPSSISRSGA